MKSHLLKPPDQTIVILVWLVDNLVFREKKYIADTKYNSKTTAFERLYHEEALKINFKQNNKQNFTKQIREIFLTCSSKIILCTFNVKH